MTSGPYEQFPMLTTATRTDLQILALRGSAIEPHADHLVVRTPDNPTYHWGNFIQVTSGDVADAERWVGRFDQEFPDAEHVAIGLPTMPPDVEHYRRLGLHLETDESLVATALPQQRPRPDGYLVRPLTPADWDHVVQISLAANTAHEELGYEQFLRAEIRARQELIERGIANWFGAFDQVGHLAADLGIVVLGDAARYQSVQTAQAHRRRGLAGHLLGVAARWAQDRGARSWVIVTKTTNDAGRLYRSCGFVPDAESVGAYRPPTRDDQPLAG